MKINIKALLLSAFLLPGIGQLYKGEKVKGAVFLVLVNFFLLAALLVVLKNMGNFLLTARISGPEEALKLLDAQHIDALSALYADLKGDVLVAQNKVAEARAAYQLALDKSETKSTYRALIQIKLDALGSAK